MQLIEYMKQRAGRGPQGPHRQALASAHGLSIHTIDSWCKGQRQHPPRLEAIEITERETGGKVTRHDLRPDVYGPA